MFMKQHYHILTQYYETEMLTRLSTGEYNIVPVRDWLPSDGLCMFTRKEVKEIQKDLNLDLGTWYLRPLFGFSGWLYNKTH